MFLINLLGGVIIDRKYKDCQESSICHTFFIYGDIKNSGESCKALEIQVHRTYLCTNVFHS